MLSLTRQERNLVFTLVVILGIGTSLIALKRLVGVDFFRIQEQRSKLELEVKERNLMVFVKGAVHDGGIYRLPLGSRVIEAIQKARPITKADLMSLPLAEFVKDGQTIVVPEADLPQEKISGKPAPVTIRAPKVNINTADIIELDGLPGVGPALASRIIAFRNEHPFVSVEDLLKVSGIGRKKFDEIKDKVQL
jgi:competence protein ComEA